MLTLFDVYNRYWKHKKRIFSNIEKLSNSVYSHSYYLINIKIFDTGTVQLLIYVQLFATPWTAACQASLSITNSQSLLKLMSIDLVMPSNHPTISSSVIPFSSCLQPCPASGSFPISQFFPPSGKSTGTLASASPSNEY